MIKKYLFLNIIVCIIISIFTLNGFADEETIVGIVGKDGEFQSDNKIYHIMDDVKGVELTQLISLKVKVTGLVEIEEDTNYITVSSYDIISE